MCYHYLAISQVSLNNVATFYLTDEELENLGRGALYRAAREGDVENGSFLCGEIAGLVNKEQSAAEIITEMCSQAEALLKGAASLVR